MQVEAVNVKAGWVALDTGVVIPIVRMLDAEGEETADPAKAVMLIFNNGWMFRPEEPTWH